MIFALVSSKLLNALLVVFFISCLLLFAYFAFGVNSLGGSSTLKLISSKIVLTSLYSQHLLTLIKQSQIVQKNNKN